MRNLKVIYLTLLHAFAAVSLFLYTNDNYTLVKIDHAPQAQAECCNGDELTAFLSSKQHGSK